MIVNRTTNFQPFTHLKKEYVPNLIDLKFCFVPIGAECCRHKPPKRQTDQGPQVLCGREKDRAREVGEADPAFG